MALKIFTAKLMMSRLRKRWIRKGRSYSLLSKYYNSILFDSIPFVRFDGQMSAKKRRDAITAFNVPVEQEQIISQRTNIRSGRPTTRTEDSYDSDSMVNDDDDDFIDHEDERAFSKKSKRKGKGKANNARFSSADGDENPRVMLLSLKAVCCLNN